MNDLKICTGIKSATDCIMLQGIILVGFNTDCIMLQGMILVGFKSFNDLLLIWARTCGCLEFWPLKLYISTTKIPQGSNLGPLMSLLFLNGMIINVTCKKLLWRRFENTHRNQSCSTDISVLQKVILIMFKVIFMIIYSSDREPVGVYNFTPSQLCISTSRIPQGSNLGPLMFLWVQKFITINLTCKKLLFGDDLKT